MSLRGQQNPASAGTEYSAMAFMVTQFLRKLNTCCPVKVVKVTNTGGLDPVGFVDVLPLVTQLAADGTPTPHQVLHNVPYFRLQGGANAVIIDPQVDDIGMCSFASRDISAVKATRAEAPPGSLRFCDWADGLYLGGFLNAAPEQYMQFNAAGITVHSPIKVTITAPAVELTGDNTLTLTSASVLINGPITQSGGSVALGGALTAPSVTTDGGVGLGTHHHGGVQIGGSNTGGPSG